MSTEKERVISPIDGSIVEFYFPPLFQDESRAIQEQLEASVQEKSLDFEEMKRRLVKAVR